MDLPEPEASGKDAPEFPPMGEEGLIRSIRQPRMEGVSVKTRMIRRTVPMVVVLLTVIMVVGAISTALAQTPGGQIGQSPPATRMDTRDDDGYGKWGLLGLLGLVGLAGLMRRERGHYTERVADRERTGRP